MHVLFLPRVRCSLFPRRLLRAASTLRRVSSYSRFLLFHRQRVDGNCICSAQTGVLNGPSKLPRDMPRPHVLHGRWTGPSLVASTMSKSAAPWAWWMNARRRVAWPCPWNTSCHMAHGCRWITHNREPAPRWCIARIACVYRAGVHNFQTTTSCGPRARFGQSFRALGSSRSHAALCLWFLLL